MSTYPASLEALLRDACRRAMAHGLSFTNQIRIYRSIIALAREVRLRIGGHRLDIGNGALSALLASVSEHASEVGLDPDLPVPDAILVQRLAVQLSRATRLCGGADAPVREVFIQVPLHREEPPRREASLGAPPAEDSLSVQHAIHREDGPQRKVAEAAEPTFSPQEPIHRENKPRRKSAPKQGDSLSAWRNDHKTERDQRAHELLRTVIDERLVAKVKAMNKRDREDWLAADQQDAA
jgi:hypothetical protein